MKTARQVPRARGQSVGGLLQRPPPDGTAVTKNHFGAPVPFRCHSDPPRARLKPCPTSPTAMLRVGGLLQRPPSGGTAVTKSRSVAPAPSRCHSHPPRARLKPCPTSRPAILQVGGLLQRPPWQSLADPYRLESRRLRRALKRIFPISGPVPGHRASTRPYTNSELGGPVCGHRASTRPYANTNSELGGPVPGRRASTRPYTNSESVVVSEKIVGPRAPDAAKLA